MRRTVALLLALPLLLGGCGWLTGRPFIQWSDDKAIQTRVKARLATLSLKNLGRVHVDVYEGVTYLSGIVDSVDAKAQAEAAVMAVSGVRYVVSNVVAKPEIVETQPAALPAAVSTAPSAPPATALARAVPAELVGVVKIEGSRAYDRAGRHVATVYTVPMTDLASPHAQRFNASRPVDHVTVHAMNPDTQVPAPHYLVVLWHVPEPKPSAAR